MPLAYLSVLSKWEKACILNLICSCIMIHITRYCFIRTYEKRDSNYVRVLSVNRLPSHVSRNKKTENSNIICIIGQCVGLYPLNNPSFTLLAYSVICEKRHNSRKVTTLLSMS